MTLPVQIQSDERVVAFCVATLSMSFCKLWHRRFCHAPRFIVHLDAVTG